MKKWMIYLALILAVGMAIGLANQPVQAQEAPAENLDTLLAQAAAKSFLITLTRPELASTTNFYLVDNVRQAGLLSQFQANPITGYQVTNSGWADQDTYRLTATLQPGQQTLVIYTGKYNGRWQVEGLELDNAPAPVVTGTTQVRAAGAGQVIPANPGLAGKLVFQTASGGDIYVINADGTGLRRLTNGIDPQLSPDSTKVAFTRWQPRYELFTINLDGSGEQALVSDWRQMKSPTWSADGKKLTFSYQSGGRLTDEEKRIDLRDAAINEDTVTVPSGARDVEIEDGILKYRLPMAANWYLQQVDVTSKAMVDLPTGEYAYSPTGHPTAPSLLVYTAGGAGIGLYDAGTNTVRQVTTDFRDRAPLISPNGTRLAVSYWQDGHWEVHTLNLDGTNRQRLTSTPLSVIAERPGLQTAVVAGKERIVAGERPEWNNAAPVWSPDGSQIAFLTDRTGKWEIWLMNADGSNQRPMFSNGALANLTLNYAGVDERMLSWR